MADNKAAILDALAKLDPTNDEQWTGAGLPQVAAVALLAGLPTLTRAEIVDAAPAWTRVNLSANPPPQPAIDTATAGNPGLTPTGTSTINLDAPTAAVAAALPSMGRIVHVHLPEAFDGANECPALVLRLNDDGSIATRIFAPHGGADAYSSNVLYIDDVDPSISVESQIYWYWPPRV